MVLYVDSMDSTSVRHPPPTVQRILLGVFSQGKLEAHKKRREGVYVDVDTRMMMGDGTMLTGIQIMNKIVAFYNRATYTAGNKYSSLLFHSIKRG